MRRVALAAVSAAAAVGLVFVSAAPANAAELPATDALYSLTDTTFYSTTSTGVSTEISTLESPGFGKYGADFDATTGLAYYFSDDGPDACILFSLDPTTGVSTLVGNVTATDMDECDALNVDSAGVLRLADQDGVVVTVNKTTGATISSVTITGDPVVDGVSAIVQDSTGQFYVTTYGGDIFTLDVTSGATALVGSPTDYIETAVFDSADTLWYSGNGDSCQGLNSVSLADIAGTTTLQGDFLEDGTTCISVYAIFISQPVTPLPPVEDDPELAATGATPTAAAALTALLALGAGAAAVAISRRASASVR